MSDKTIGKCSCCGGRVVIPTYYYSVNAPIPTCKSCGAEVDETEGLPVIKTRQVKSNYEYSNNKYWANTDNLLISKF